MSNNGTFEIEDQDIVRLRGSDGGWINYGFFAVKIERHGEGIRVEVYPSQNELVPLASVSVADPQAVVAGGINCEGDSGDEGEDSER